MKPSNELHQLIHSLTKSEKRFFKLHSSLQEGEKNYLKIFDAIDKQAEYEEEDLKGLFKNETFIRHFPSEKNHLYKQILKSLRAYHSDNSISSILKQEIKNIEILYNKALFRECNKFLYRAKKLAIAHEKFYFLFELISWEKMLLEEAFEDGEFTKDLDTLISEEQQVIEKLRNLAAYHVLYSKINYVFRSGGFARDEESRKLIDEIANHPLIAGKNTALSHRAATICYYIQGFCQLAHGDYKTALDKFTKVKTILDTNPNLKKDLAKRYTRTVSNMISCLIDKGDFTQAEIMIQDLKNIAEEPGFGSTDIMLTIFKNCSIAELQICHRKGDFSGSLVKLENILAGLEEYEGKLHKEQEIGFFFHIAYTYFGVGQYSKALTWINKVLNDNESTLRQDVYSYARIFNLVIHYELGNYDLLEYITKSTQRYLSRRQRDFEMELLIIDYLRKLIRTTNIADQRQLFVKFKAELEKSVTGPQDEIVLRYFDFGAWIESKIAGASFSETIRALSMQTA